MAVNYNNQMENLIKQLPCDSKPKLLLHSCCAPCSSACLERLTEHFEVTVYYYNPNIDTASEYFARAEEQVRLCASLNIPVIKEEYCADQFLTAVSGHEGDLEGGLRCGICFALRLEKTANKAKETGYEYFATTLTVSPLKDAERLNKIGQAIGEKFGIKWLPSDFKKKGGYLRSIELSKQHNLYRQNYCGCVFSKNQQR